MTTKDKLGVYAEKVATPVGEFLGIPSIGGFYSPDPQKSHYDTTYGVPDEYKKAADRYRKGLAPDMASQEELLKRQKAYATGEKSQSRETGANQLAAQQSRIQSVARGAQRGGRNASVQRGAAYAGEQVGRDIGVSTDIAAQLERQKATEAYAKSAAAHAQQQLAAEKASRGYSQLGIQDKQRSARANQLLDELYGAKRAKLTEYEIKDREEELGFIASLVKGAGDLVSTLFR